MQLSKRKNTRGYATVLTSAAVCVCVSHCVSTVTLFGRSVAVTAAASGGGGAPMATAAEATAEEVPNVELVVETATSCDRSRLCMRLPDRHLAYTGGCILSAGQAQAGAIHYAHDAYSTRLLLCGKLRTDQCLYSAVRRPLRIMLWYCCCCSTGEPTGKIKLRCPPGFRLYTVYVTNEPPDLH